MVAPRSKLPEPDGPDLLQLMNNARKIASRQVVPTGDEDMSSSKFFIPTLPGLSSSSTLTMYGGHIPSAPNAAAEADSDSHLFFFLVRNRHIAETERTIVWFNGGPGCSSFDGSMMEVGPFRLQPGSGGKLREVEGAWNEYANVLFIDQPVGTGYSYMATNAYVHELSDASLHVGQFLVKFYEIFPEFATHDTYLAGESYAGQYIPYIAEAILANALLPNPKGLMIGNGWIDPYNQYPAFLEFSLQAGLVKKGSDVENNVRKLVINCLADLDKLGVQNVKIHNGNCENILGAITDSTVQSVNGQNMCVNNYDVRLTDTHPACGMNWPPDLADIQPYLSRTDVKSAFHASRKEGGWVECNGNVGAQFWVTYSKPSVQILPKLLESIPILLFAGDQDLICNHVGIERLIEKLEWNGETGFGNATTLDWRVDGKPAGTWTTARNLTYVKVADASHMVPYDQPLASHDMVLRFLGVDLLGAAGPAAQVPSRIGNEQEAVLGETHPNGTAVSVPIELDSTSKQISNALAENSTVEALVNAGSAIVIIALMALGVVVFCALRRRSRRGLKGKGPILALSRGSNLGRGQGVEEDTDGPHELDELVVDGDYHDTSAGERPNHGPRRHERKSSKRDSRKMREAEEVFGIGSDDEDEIRRKVG